MGKLIVIEGLDATGKETQTKLLLNNLLDRGQNVQMVSFPDYDSPSSSLVKMYLSGDFGKKPGDVNAYAASSFYAVDRYASFKTKWQSFYDGGGTVIADRYTTSNIIHQASKIRDVQTLEQYLGWIEDFEYTLMGLPRPDVVFFLNLPLDISIKMMQTRNNKFSGESQKDIHESDINYLAATYDSALRMCERFGWTKIPCGDNGEMFSIEQIQKQILGKLGIQEEKKR